MAAAALMLEDPAPAPPCVQTRPTRAVARLITLLAETTDLIPRWDLADRLEGGQAVTDDRLRKLVERARRSLGPGAIENVWGRGYRLTAEGRVAWTRLQDSAA